MSTCTDYQLFSFSGKCTLSGYMHADCFIKYEETIVGYMSKAGRGRTWNEKQVGKSVELKPLGQGPLFSGKIAKPLLIANLCPHADLFCQMVPIMFAFEEGRIAQLDHWPEVLLLTLAVALHWRRSNTNN